MSRAARRRKRPLPRRGNSVPVFHGAGVCATRKFPACRDVVRRGQDTRPTNPRNLRIKMANCKFPSGRRGGLQAARAILSCREQAVAASTHPCSVGRGRTPPRERPGRCGFPSPRTFHTNTQTYKTINKPCVGAACMRPVRNAVGHPFPVQLPQPFYVIIKIKITHTPTTQQGGHPL